MLSPLSAPFGGQRLCDNRAMAKSDEPSDEELEDISDDISTAYKRFSLTRNAEESDVRHKYLLGMTWATPSGREHSWEQPSGFKTVEAAVDFAGDINKKDEGRQRPKLMDHRGT
jgi:hypothetical protein